MLISQVFVALMLPAT
jgi:hypothetical protein